MFVILLDPLPFLLVSGQVKPPTLHKTLVDPTLLTRGALDGTPTREGGRGGEDPWDGQGKTGWTTELRHRPWVGVDTLLGEWGHAGGDGRSLRRADLNVRPDVHARSRFGPGTVPTRGTVRTIRRNLEPQTNNFHTRRGQYCTRTLRGALGVRTRCRRLRDTRPQCRVPMSDRPYDTYECLPPGLLREGKSHWGFLSESLEIQVQNLRLKFTYKT